MVVKLYKNREWLEQKYNKEQLSDLQIAKLCRVYPGTIGVWRKKFNIVSRSHGESQNLATGNHCNLTKEAIEWINGELLGDGSIVS